MLLTPRSGATATVLESGDVLVVGGESLARGRGRRPSASMQGERVESGASLLEGRIQHTATRLTDGTVLVAGGAFDGSDAARLRGALRARRERVAAGGAARPGGAPDTRPCCFPTARCSSPVVTTPVVDLASVEVLDPVTGAGRPQPACARPGRSSR